jgi:hypothetical protein
MGKDPSKSVAAHSGELHDTKRHQRVSHRGWGESHDHVHGTGQAHRRLSVTCCGLCFTSARSSKASAKVGRCWLRCNRAGKEVRVGVAQRALWAAATTVASNGSVNAMHDNFTPLGGLIPMWLMQLGEVVFGGVGSGLYGFVTEPGMGYRLRDQVKTQPPAAR